MIAHALLGSLHSEPILACLATEGPARPASAVRALACAILDSPELPVPGSRLGAVRLGAVRLGAVRLGAVRLGIRRLRPQRGRA